MSAQVQRETGTSGPRFDIGDAVIDSEDESPDTAIVINFPNEPCSEWDCYTEDDGTQVTVADDNPSYPDDAPVVVVLFVEQIEQHYPEWTGDDPLSLSEVSAQDITHYGFPPGRLEPAPSNPVIDEDREADAGGGVDDDAAATSPQRDPPTGLQELADEVRSGATVEIVDAGDEWRLEITKLGIEYEITEGGEVRGSGPHADAFAEKAASFL
jgi:hypothetical protein